MSGVMLKSKEEIHLGKIAEDSRYCQGVNFDTIVYSFEIFSRFIKGDSILELGPAEGVMTDKLATLGKKLTVVEGAELFCAALRQRHPEIEVHQSLFESFKSEKKYDNIILGHVLEHVEKPVEILRHCKNWLSPQGQILAAVPNSQSLHRQAAVIMGLLKHEEMLNESDIHHGHRRVYNSDTFCNDFLSAGLAIEKIGGYWLKPVSNSQIEKDWNKNMLDAFMKLGEKYPEIAGEIYIIARLNS